MKKERKRERNGKSARWEERMKEKEPPASTNDDDTRNMKRNTRPARYLGII